MKDLELFTVEEVATFLKIAPNTVYRWCRDGKLTGIKIGKEWRITRKDLDRFLARQAGTAELTSLTTLLKQQMTAPEHILVMASDPEAIYRLQAEFFEVGLRAGHSLFMGAWWQRPAEIRSKLTAAGLPVAELEASGKFTIGDFRVAYEANGPQGVIDIWREQGVKSGGQVFWGTGSHRLSDWNGRIHDLMRFESELHQAFQEMPVVALCPCVLDPVDRPGFEALINLVPHHSAALFMPGGEPLLMRATN